LYNYASYHLLSINVYDCIDISPLGHLLLIVPEHEAEDEVDEGEDEKIGVTMPTTPATYPRLKIKINLPASTPSGSAGTINRRCPSGEMSIQSYTFIDSK